MQTETMAVLAGGETVGENLCEVFRGNSDTVVDHFYEDTFLALALGANGQLALRRLFGVHRFFRVADQVDENLEDFVAFGAGGRGRAKVAVHVNVVPLQRVVAQLKSILDCFWREKRFDYAGNRGVALLHPNNVLHVADAF